MEGHLTAGEYFGRYRNAGGIQKRSHAVYNKFTCSEQGIGTIYVHRLGRASRIVAPGPNRGSETFSHRLVTPLKPVFFAFGEKNHSKPLYL